MTTFAFSSETNRQLAQSEMEALDIDVEGANDQLTIDERRLDVDVLDIVEQYNGYEVGSDDDEAGG